MLLDPPQRPRRKPSLTPMIDVVFLLLVFFMLASRFGVDAALSLPLAAGGGDYSGPPRLIDVAPTQLFLNGRPVAETGLTAALLPLVETKSDVLILRGKEGADLQRIVTLTEMLRSEGFTSVVLVE
ncbi:ExbD/TolR family protein [Tritonibacter horizontis]|uniref:Biopolymer transport protein ExbD n=1 Tax=Tritonibacter horizontis TaxID=1768241 RepID=A0A132BTV2_9RHOB|nr:biopolymer transporter ExbD [Tritonibacter horizontis]KUP91492.1 biopolymer transport protein ExbD [Tritonibacter horizontis]